MIRCEGAPELARHLQGDLRAKQGRDGAWYEGDLQESDCRRIWQPAGPGSAGHATQTDNSGARLVVRVSGTRTGAYGAGCTPARHEQRICEHYVNGLFQPRLSRRGIGQSLLPNGQAVTSDAGARLLMSERALRSALRAQPTRSAGGSLGGGACAVCPLYLEYGGSLHAGGAGGCVAGACLDAEPEARASWMAGLEVAGGRAQAKDGTWPKVEFFFVLEMLLESEAPVGDDATAESNFRGYAGDAA